MLTIENIIELYEEGVDVKVNWHKQTHRDTGRWGSKDSNDISLYLKNINSQKDLDLTILHEFIHARNFCLLEIDDDNEIEVENEAKLLYQNSPEVLIFIKEFYNLNKLKIK